MLPQMIKLLADNKNRAVRSKIVAAEKEATLYLYDVIVATDADTEWFGGVSAESLVKQIRELKVDTIHLRINSPGGDVFAGRAIEQALRDHPADIIAYIDGYAASAASFVMLAADKISMAKGAFIMIHNAWTFAYGNAQEITKTVNLLEKIDLSIAESYAARIDQPLETIKEWMNAETWFSAQEAVDHGFADEISESDVEAKKAKRSWNLAAYKNAPKAPADTITENAHEEPPAEPAVTTDFGHLLRMLEVANATA